MNEPLRICGLKITRIPGFYDPEYGWNPLLILEWTQFKRRNRRLRPWIIICSIIVLFILPIGFSVISMHNDSVASNTPMLVKYYLEALFWYSSGYYLALLVVIFVVTAFYAIVFPVPECLTRRKLEELPTELCYEKFVVPILWLRFPLFLTHGVYFLFLWLTYYTFGNMKGFDLSSPAQLLPIVVGVILASIWAMHIRIFFEVKNYSAANYSFLFIILPFLPLIVMPNASPGPEVTPESLWCFVIIMFVLNVLIPKARKTFLEYVRRRGQNLL
jgi:hypothetical protein